MQLYIPVRLLVRECESRLDLFFHDISVLRILGTSKLLKLLGSGL